MCKNSIFLKNYYILKFRHLNNYKFGKIIFNPTLKNSVAFVRLRVQ